jgi:hypothetical protein
MFSGLQVRVKVLQRRLVTRNLRTMLLILVQWFESPPSLATWEDYEVVHQRLPQAPDWKQAGFLWRGMS